MFRRFAKSVRCALRGFLYAVHRERNFQIEILCALFVVGSLFVFDFAVWEKAILLLTTGWVLTLELLNTVVERVINIVRPRNHPYPGIIKDLMASAVLISSLAAFCAGAVIIVPHLIE